MTSAEEACAEPVQAVQIDLQEIARRPHAARDRLRSAGALGLALLVHVAVLVPFPFGTDAEPPPVEEVIPVELVTEPEPAPPPEPEPEPAKEEKEPEPQPREQQKLDEKPANEAARSADQDKERGRSTEKPDMPKPQETQAAPPAAAAPQEELREAEALEPAAPKVPTLLKPEMKAFTGLKPIPDFQFEMPAMRTDFKGGQADPRYLTTLYGMIMKHMITPDVPAPEKYVEGRVLFGVSSDGRIFQEAVVIKSGLPSLDRAALTAVRNAAPYPPPPNGGPIYIRFDYGPK